VCDHFKKPANEPYVAELLAQDPRLVELIREALDTWERPDAPYCRDLWHKFDGGPGRKARLNALVGPYSGRDGALGTQAAWYVMTDLLLTLARPCRGCP
jgi:hypothetical protein